MKSEILLKGENLSKYYGGVTALENVDVDIARGEVHCLVGENGSGKSTLVKIITGVIKPERGSSIEFNGYEYSSLRPIQAYERGIQVVHQDLSMFPNMTVAENIGIGQYIEHSRVLVSWSRIMEKASLAFERLGIDFDRHTRLGDLSLADQQLVAIGRALASDAQLLIMDEPTASLTQEEVDQLFTIIRELKEKDVTTLFISHRLDEVLEIGDRITVLRNGKKIDTVKKEETSKEGISYLMTGKEVEYRNKLSPLEDEKTILRVDGLSDGESYRNVSFELDIGEVLGLIGPLGAGQSKLALSLFGLNPPEDGTIELDGQNVKTNSISRSMEMGIGYVPADRLTQGLVLEQPIDNNLILTSFERFVDKRTGLINPNRKDEFVEGAVDEFDIKIGDPKDRVLSLSGGNQQKVVVAKWVSIEPKILILNRPTNGIDIAAKANIFDLIADLADKGMSIILISDEVEEIMHNSHKIMIMKGGEIVDRTTPEEITGEELYHRMTSSKGKVTT